MDSKKLQLERVFKEIWAEINGEELPQIPNSGTYYNITITKTNSSELLCEIPYSDILLLKLQEESMPSSHKYLLKKELTLNLTISTENTYNSPFVTSFYSSSDSMSSSFDHNYDLNIQVFKDGLFIREIRMFNTFISQAHTNINYLELTMCPGSWTM